VAGRYRAGGESWRSNSAATLARDSVDGQEVGPVVARLQVEDGVGEWENVGERRSRLDPVREHHDARVIRAELDFVLRQDHPVAELATHLALLELQTVRQYRARQRNAHGRAGAEVPRPADDLARVAFPDVDLAQLQPVRIRMLDCLENPSDAEEPRLPSRSATPTVSNPSTSQVEMTSRSASSRIGISIGTYSRSQLTGTFT